MEKNHPALCFKASDMKNIFLFCLSIGITFSSCSQNNKQRSSINKEIKVGGDCEGCHAVYESPVPFAMLNEVDTLPDFNEPGPKIEISGIIYKPDGKTPARGVILYVYHTDQNGLYSNKDNDPLVKTEWSKRHGYIRGWIKTNDKGEYKLYTLVPVSYPNSTNPKHIHPVIKEPRFSEYWIDEFLFADDPLLPAAERNKRNPVAGSGVLKTIMKDGMLRATRNIILGLNVRDYPKQ
jgi:protocatechuate 3,4-dioxygenase beta subunit